MMIPPTEESPAPILRANNGKVGVNMNVVMYIKIAVARSKIKFFVHKGSK